MKQIVTNVLMMFLLLLQACDSGKEPIRNDIIGSWKSSDGASFKFDKDSSFIAKSFPAEVVFHLDSQFTNVRFDGNGKWLLRKGSTHWEVYLDFKQVSDKKCSSAFPLLIAGKKGVLENQPPWYLFVWKEEEGGERYEFEKK